MSSLFLSNGVKILTPLGGCAIIIMEEVTMIEADKFRDWLTVNTKYSKEVIGDTVSRAKRADKILVWFNDDIYFYMLGKEKEYLKLSSSVKSQLRKAIKLYFQFVNGRNENETV